MKRTEVKTGKMANIKESIGEMVRKRTRRSGGNLKLDIGQSIVLQNRGGNDDIWGVPTCCLDMDF